MGNSVKCSKCNDIITSQHRHDYQSCKCKSIAVDGGDVYNRYVGDLENILILQDGAWVPLIEDNAHAQGETA